MKDLNDKYITLSPARTSKSSERLNSSIANSIHKSSEPSSLSTPHSVCSITQESLVSTIVPDVWLFHEMRQLCNGFLFFRSASIFFITTQTISLIQTIGCYSCFRLRTRQSRYIGKTKSGSLVHTLLN